MSAPLRVLVWQWGRRGAGPRFAAGLHLGFAELPGCTAHLSLSNGAEILAGASAPVVDVPMATYGGAAGFALRLASTFGDARALARRLAKLRLDGAICAMPAPMDLTMAFALRRLGVPFTVLVHDADLHPGDGLPLQMPLQRALLRRADALGALTAHVAARLRAQGVRKPILDACHPPFAFSPAPPPALAHGGPPRLLFFGRLLPYKGLDLLADALAAGTERPALRVVGHGPDSPELARLAAMPGVTVENRWVPEQELGALIGWADALVLPYREASQSGVAAAALAAGRWVIGTEVGGLAEQLRGAPGARLCAPEPAALAAALAAFLANPGPPPPVLDAAAGWRDLAAGLASAMPRR